jgi:hypothetical protein
MDLPVVRVIVKIKERHSIIWSAIDEDGVF